MRIVRLSISEPLGTCEWIHYRLPVRIGRHQENDCQLWHPAVSPFHLELDWAQERFILRDLGTRPSVLVRIAGDMQQVRGRELTTAARDIEFAIAGVWVRASVEERPAHPIAEAAQEAVDALVGSCTRATLPELGQERALMVLGALGRGAVTLRGSLQADRERTELGRAGQQDEVTAALARWAAAAAAAIAFVEEVLQGGGGLNDDHYDSPART